jgi:hypothetical protein
MKQEKKKADCLFIRNIPAEVCEALRVRAKNKRMTLAGVIIDLVESNKWK